MALAGSQRLRAQDSAPVQRHDTEGIIEPGPRDGREETVMLTGTGTETRTARRVEGRKSPETCEVIVEVG